MVLAAGAGRRLRPLTETLPKALLPVQAERSILEITLENMCGVGLTDVVVVVGFAAGRVRERVPGWQRDYGVRLELVHNDRAEHWNNAYSLWCARRFFDEGVLLCNGDMVHPRIVEERVLAQRGADLLLAVDREKQLGEEEMKVTTAADGSLTRITKLMDPAAADGEYIGMALIEPSVAPALADALQATFTLDPQLYYEDGFQELVDRARHVVGTAPIGAVDWVEVDDHVDLARAREMACRF